MHSRVTSFQTLFLMLISTTHLLFLLDQLSNSLDFPSVKESANHMKAAASNSTLYNKYFNSRYKPTLCMYSNDYKSSRFCPLCRHIATNHSTKTCKSVCDWYSNRTLCRQYPVPVWLLVVKKSLYVFCINLSFTKTTIMYMFMYYLYVMINVLCVIANNW